MTTKLLIVGNTIQQIKVFATILEGASYFPIYYEWILTTSIPQLKLQHLTHKLVILLNSNINIPHCDFNIAVYTFDTSSYSDHKYVHPFNTVDEVCILIGKIYIKGGLVEKEKKKIDLTVKIPTEGDYIIPDEELLRISTPINRSISPIH